MDIHKVIRTTCRMTQWIPARGGAGGSGPRQHEPRRCLFHELSLLFNLAETDHMTHLSEEVGGNVIDGHLLEVVSSVTPMLSIACDVSLNPSTWKRVSHCHNVSPPDSNVALCGVMYTIGPTVSYFSL